MQREQHLVEVAEFQRRLEGRDRRLVELELALDAVATAIRDGATDTVWMPERPAQTACDFIDAALEVAAEQEALEGAQWDGGRICNADAGSWRCTRRPGHPRSHIAASPTRIMEKWQ